jgi:hypothetical protein
MTESSFQEERALQTPVDRTGVEADPATRGTPVALR